MTKKIIIFGVLIITALLLFFQQTKWGISVGTVEAVITPFYEGEIAQEIEEYKEYGADGFFGSGQGWEEPEIFPSKNDQEYCKVILLFAIKNCSILNHTLLSARVNNSNGNANGLYYAFDLLEDNPTIKGLKKSDHEYILHLEIYKNGRTDEEIIRDLSELKIELHYSNKVFQLTKTIDLSKVKLSLLDKNPFDPN